MQSKISEMQAWILERLFFQSLLEIGFDPADSDNICPGCRAIARERHLRNGFIGVAWRSVHNPNPSLSADFSRSLARLESRGLVVRKNKFRPDSERGKLGRTTHVLLTRDGWEEAEFWAEDREESEGIAND